MTGSSWQAAGPAPLWTSSRRAAAQRCGPSGRTPGSAAARSGAPCGWTSANSAVIAPTSQISSSSSPAARAASRCSADSRAGSVARTRARSTMARSRGGQRRGPRVGRHPVRDLRVLGADPQDRPVRHHAVDAVVRAGGRDDDELPLGLGQAALALHERVVVVEERPQLRGATGEGAEHVRHEPGLLGDRLDPLAQVVGQVCGLDVAEAAHRVIVRTVLRHGCDVSEPRGGAVRRPACSTWPRGTGDGARAPRR